MRHTTKTLAAVVLLGCAAAACNGGDDGEGAAGAATVEVTTTTATTAAPTRLGVVGDVDAPFTTQYTTVAAGDLWLPNPDDGQVTRIDGDTGELLAEVPVGDPAALGTNADPQSVTSDPEGLVWAAVASTRSATRIDPATDAVVASVPLGVEPYALAVTATDIWATDFGGNVVVRVDRATQAEVARFDVGSPTAVVEAFDALWVVGHRTGQVVRIDPATDEVTDRVQTPGTDLEQLAAVGDSLWVSAHQAEGLRRIDPDTLEVTAIPLGAPTYGVTGGPDGVWVTVGPVDGCDAQNSSLVLLDPERGEEVDRLRVECAFALGALPGGLVVVGADSPPEHLVLVRRGDG